MLAGKVRDFASNGCVFAGREPSFAGKGSLLAGKGRRFAGKCFVLTSKGREFAGKDPGAPITLTMPFDHAQGRRALSIRQPFAELILRGIKTVELRSISTNIIQQRFYIYTPLKRASVDVKTWSRDLAMPDGRLPDWMIELAEQVGMIEPDFDKLSRAIALLPTGVIVGSAVIEKVTQAEGIYRWHLAGAERAKKLRKPAKHPQPVWFKPF